MNPKLPLINPYLDLRLALSTQADALQLDVRKKLIWAYSWAVPSTEAVRALAELGPIVELGAGTGYWAWLIGQAGAAVRAMDQAPDSPPRWVPIHPGGPTDLAAASEPTLLLCWPPLDEPMAAEALAAFPGMRLAYIGEWRGRTGDAVFHDTIERDWIHERTIALPSWPGFKDELRVYSRRNRETP